MEETRRGKSHPGGKVADPRKVSIYLPQQLLEWLSAQNARLDRSVSWIVQHALLHSKDWVEKMPGLNDPPKPSARLPDDQLQQLAVLVAEELRRKG